jgi:quinoprotein glucose dehydrogenase
LVLSGCSTADSTLDEVTYREWRHFGGDPTNSQFSTLDQINTDNVTQLEQVWVHHTGDANSGGSSQIQFNPIIVDGVLYGATPRLKLFAIDAATGESRWTFDPNEGEEAPQGFGISRGVSYWEEGDDRRLLFGVRYRLYAIDADTGEPVASFGHDGYIDLADSLDQDTAGLSWSLNTPGVVFEDLYIVGGSVSERLPAAPGHIRAYDVRTGERAWIFHTIPHPGEFGYDTWPEDAWQRIGGANSWSGMSLDYERGVVYIPTGSAAFDFWGGNRLGENLFANSILALDARTGERLWHFQTVKHDVWDRDLPAAPNLLTVEHEGRRVDVVAQITKSGHVFMLDRDTGESIFPLDELEPPASDLEGEQTWPTQVLPSKPEPFARQRLTVDELSTISPESTAAIQDSLARLRSDGQFVPPSAQGTIIFPGFDGGGEWGGAAHDPASGILYVNANELPWVLQMRPVGSDSDQQTLSPGQQVYNYSCSVCHGLDRSGTFGFPSLVDIEARKTREEVQQIIRTGGNRMPGFGHLADTDIEALVAFLFGDTQPDISVSLPDVTVKYNHMGYNRFFDENGFPAVKPPWGTLNAIDLNAGEILWQVPLGEYAELVERGLPITGTQNYGGPVVTSGGLLFIGASLDEYFRAFDRESGEELWKTKLPAAGYATPATYEVNGRQFVVIAAGGGKLGTPSGDAYVAFALPE